MGRATASRVALAIIIVAATLAGGLPRSFAQGSGSELVEEVASHEYGDNAQARLEDASGFAASGGDAIFEPGTQSEEAFSYDSVDYETNRLIGLTRPDAAGHPVGSFVESVATATEPPAESPSPSPTPTQSETTTPSDSGSSTSIDEGDSAASSSDEAATSAGVIPGPCDIVSALCAVVPPIDVGCEGCDTIVEEILDLVRPCLEKSGCAEPVMAVVRTVVYEACGTDDLLYCEDKYSRLIYELVDQLCPYGLTTCADPYVNFVADLIMGIVCPSGSLGYCAGELNRQVNEQLAVVVGIAKSYVVYACGGETTTDCANRVLDILYKTVLPIVCQAGDVFTCVDNTADRINDVVANACSFEKSALDSSETGATAECVSRVLATVQLVIKTANDAMILACQSTDANTCLRNLLETVDETLSLACSFIPGLSTTPGVNRCVERTLDLVDLAVEIAQQEIADTCGSSDPRRCVEMATGEAFKAVDAVNDLLANTCKQSIGATTSTSDDAVANCVARVLSTAAAVQQLVIKTANDAMILACQSTDANTCLRNLLETVDETLSTACSFIPGLSTTPGANRCVERTLDLVDLAVEIAQQKIAETCGSSDPRRCVEMATGEAFKAVDAVNDLIANTCKQNIGATTSTSDDAVANCVARALLIAAQVQEIVRAKMIEVCGGSDANACVAMILRRAETEVNKTCRSLPGVTTTTGIDECVDKTIQLVDSLVERAKQAMRDTCGSDVATICADNVVGQLLATIDKVNDAAARACKSDTAVTSPTSDSAITNCVNKFLEILDFAVRTGGEAMVEICGSTAADACAEDLLRQVDGLVGTVCGVIPAGTTTSSGPTTCAEKAVQVVTEVYRVACAADSSADACGSRYVAAVTEIVVGAAATAYQTACGGSLQIGDTSCATRYGDALRGMADAVVEQAYRVICPADESLNSCGSRYADAAAGIVVALFDTAYSAVCGSPTAVLSPTTSLTACVDRYVRTVSEVVGGPVGTAHRVICPFDPTTENCAARYVETVDAMSTQVLALLYDSACSDTYSGNPSSVSTCLNRQVDVLIELIAAVVGEICSNGAAECFADYVDLTKRQAEALVSLYCPGLQCAGPVLQALADELARLVEETCAVDGGLCHEALAEILSVLRDPCAASTTGALCPGEGDMPSTQPVPVTPDGSPVVAPKICGDGFTPDGMQLCVLGSLDTARFSLTGRVMTEDGFVPVPGGRVTLVAGGVSVSAITDPNGQFAFANVPVPDGATGATVRVEAAGFGLYEVTNHHFEGAEGYGLSVLIGPEDHREEMPEENRPEGSSSGPDRSPDGSWSSTTPAPSSPPTAPPPTSSPTPAPTSTPSPTPPATPTPTPSPTSPPPSSTPTPSPTAPPPTPTPTPPPAETSPEEQESYDPGERVSASSAKDCTDTGNSFDHCRTPALVTVQEYKGCGSTKEGDPQTVPWKYYVLHVVGPEVGGEFDGHDLEDEKANAYMRANFSIASNFAWFRRLIGQGTKGNPLSGSVNNAQCYNSDKPISDWWDPGDDDARAKANYPLSWRWFDTSDEANSPQGLAETVFRAGSHDGCEPPYHFVYLGVDTNFFSQHDAANCAKTTDWGWATIVDVHYPDNRTSKGWELKEVWKPDFDKAKASTSSDGKVGVDWGGTGIWHSTVHRCTSNNPDSPPVCNVVIFDGGFSGSCGCIKTFVKDDARRGTTYKIRVDGPGGDKIKYVTY